MLSPLLAVLAAAVLPTDFGEPPRELEPFCRHIVQARSAEGLNRLVLDTDDARFGTVYGGRPEDANVAWIAAYAYRYDWSRFHRDPALRERAFLLLDSLARIRADGRWDDGGLDAYFGLQSFAWAVLSWLETGDVDAARAEMWREAVAAAAEDAMLCNHRRMRAGAYANPEFYYMAGLAAAWRICDEPRYLAEAAAVLERYENVLWEGGGVAYFYETSPQHGYQEMITRSVALLWDLTRDAEEAREVHAHAFSWLRRLAPYFVRVQHRSGLLTDAEHPWLKHSFYSPVNPAVPGMLACALGEGPLAAQNRHVAEVATRIRGDNVANRMPSFLSDNPNWYNYHHTTYAAALLRLLERGGLPEAAAPPERWCGPDEGFRGVRSHWDDFTAAVGTRQMNDSLAGAYVADPSEPMWPLDSAVDGVYFEVLEGDRGPEASPAARARAHYRCVDWTPTVQFTEAPGFAAVSCLSRLCSPYWGDLPWLPGERWSLKEVSDWTAIQHWAVWRDHLVGLGALRCHAAGGDPATDDLARVRWRLSPVGRELDAPEPAGGLREVAYGKTRLRVEILAERGGFDFAAADDGEAPYAPWSPTLERPAPWATGDFLNVATVVHPAGSEGAVHFRALNEAGAALLVEPGERRALLWVASLVRHWRQHTLDLPPGVRVTLFKREISLTPAPPPGGPAYASLGGAESAVWLLEADAPLDPDALLDGLQSGWGRGERAPTRD